MRDLPNICRTNGPVIDISMSDINVSTDIQQITIDVYIQYLTKISTVIYQCQISMAQLSIPMISYAGSGIETI